MKKALVLVVLMSGVSFADLTWQTPLGTIGLPFQATEALTGYDAVLKQAIGGFSLPVYQSSQKLLSAQLGAVAPWQTHDATIEPYVGAGLDALRLIPNLSQYQSAHVNIFGRYASAQGKAGVGISVSYSFAQP